MSNVWTEQMERLGAAANAAGRKPVVLDVGAYDGLYQSAFWHAIENWGWGGVLIEPVLRSYRRLAARWASRPDVRCLRCAIAETCGRLQIRIPADDAPDWQQGSSTAAVLQRELCDEPGWTLESVPSLTLQIVLDALDVTAIDAVSIDTEGMDWIVLDQLDLKRYWPACLKWEVCQLSAADLAASIDYVRAFGYHTEPMLDKHGKPWDMVAYLQ